MRLTNLCNCNTGKVKIDVLSSIFVLIEKFDTNKKSQLIMVEILIYV